MAKKLTPREVACEAVEIEDFPATGPGMKNGYVVRVCKQIVYRGEQAERANTICAAGREAIELYVRATRSPSPKKGKARDAG